MDVLLIVAVIVIGFAVVIYFINKKSAPSSEMMKIFSLLQEGSQQDRQVLLQSLQANSRDLNQRLDNASKVIGEVQKNVGEMSEIGRSMRDLQEFLQSPKLRGNIGEQVLKELLAQMLPKNTFHLQYTFKSGEKVDAAIKTSSGIVPIDSKFPMENFRKMMNNDDGAQLAKKNFERDVKRHIDSISKKYILTEEGTIDYALMYVPSEAVYYEIVNSSTLFDYAGKRRVLPVSPTTFYAYMKAILMSFEGNKIESRAKEILSTLNAMKKDYSKVEDNLRTLGKHITNANNMMGNVTSDFEKLGSKIDRTKSLED
jgi:DNA recombination protein RmuC